MSISFLCDRCGHPVDVDDHLAGMHGHCKHCGHRLVVPAAGHGLPRGEGHPEVARDEAPAPSLRLRPLDGEEPPRVADHLLAPPSPLKVRPAGAEPQPRPQAVSAPDSDADSEPGSDSAPPADARRSGSGRRRNAPGPDYTVLDPFHVTMTRSSLGPPPFWWLFPSLTARFLARQFRTLRDRLYVVSLFFLVLVLIGYLFHVKLLLHLGAVGVIGANIGMLAAGVAYLVTLPFKESLRHGLATIFVPFYAFYYWATRWPKVKTAVVNTLGSFLPLFLVALAYVVYEEGPVVEQTVEKELPVLEQALEKHVPALDRKVDQVLEPLEKRVP